MESDIWAPCAPKEAICRATSAIDVSSDFTIGPLLARPIQLKSDFRDWWPYRTIPLPTLGRKLIRSISFHRYIVADIRSWNRQTASAISRFPKVRREIRTFANYYSTESRAKRGWCTPCPFARALLLVTYSAICQPPRWSALVVVSTGLTSAQKV